MEELPGGRGCCLGGIFERVLPVSEIDGAANGYSEANQKIKPVALQPIVALREPVAQLIVDRVCPLPCPTTDCKYESVIPWDTDF